MSFLNDSSTPVNENSWFDFDRLLFNTGNATLRPASQEQLSNIAAIRTAPQQRADNVMGELTRRGVDPSRMSAKGYGEESPIADNSTEEGRKRIAASRCG